MQKGGILC